MKWLKMNVRWEYLLAGLAIIIAAHAAADSALLRVRGGSPIGLGVLGAHYGSSSCTGTCSGARPRLLGCHRPILACGDHSRIAVLGLQVLWSVPALGGPENRSVDSFTARIPRFAPP